MKIEESTEEEDDRRVDATGLVTTICVFAGSAVGWLLADGGSLLASQFAWFAGLTGGMLLLVARRRSGKSLGMAEAISSEVARTLVGGMAWIVGAQVALVNILRLTNETYDGDTAISGLFITALIVLFNHDKLNR